MSLKPNAGRVAAFGLAAWIAVGLPAEILADGVTPSAATPSAPSLATGPASATVDPASARFESQTAGGPQALSPTVSAAVPAPLGLSLGAATGGAAPGLTFVAAVAAGAPQDLSPGAAGATDMAQGLTALAATGGAAPQGLTPPSTTTTGAFQSLSPQASGAVPAPQDLSPSASASVPVPGEPASDAGSGAAVTEPTRPGSGPAATVLPAGAPPLPDQVPPQTAPAQVLPAPEAPKVEAPESKYRWTNFVYGFVGGALLGVAYGVLSDSTGKASTRNIAAELYGLGGGIGLGSLALVLGATTPEDAKPPQSALGRPTPTLQVALRF